MIKQWLYMMGIAVYGFFFVSLLVTCGGAWLSDEIHWYNVAGAIGQFLIGLSGIVFGIVYMVNRKEK